VHKPNNILRPVVFVEQVINRTKTINGLCSINYLFDSFQPHLENEYTTPLVINGRPVVFVEQGINRTFSGKGFSLINSLFDSFKFFQQQI
jgi:hypothetical protein